ncbi:MAG TPA: hypothetical protein ENJ95_11565, partial [Bacteroidetes bacterium]|nr:hypothetical protein [Bacteroidota bacterium]
MNQENIKNDKPKWLRRLERESWQAELIVSGIAIFGSLQLPGLIENMAGECISFFSQDAYTGLYFFFLYLLFSANFLIVFLIVHFVTRALWIGLIGLNSVFPEGIKKENKTYAPHFMERLIADFPKDIRYIERLDHFCSVIFSFIALLVMTMLAIAVDVVIVFGLKYLLKDYLPEGLSQSLGDLIAAFLLFFSALMLLLNSKILKETTFAKKYHYPVLMGFSKLMLHVFYKPVTRISYIFSSNFSMKKYRMAVILFMIPISFFSIN